MLALLNEGLQNSQIAGRLVVSVKTAEHHVEAILRKLGARTRADRAGHGHLARDSCRRILNWGRTGKTPLSMHSWKSASGSSTTRRNIAWPAVPALKSLSN